MKKAGYLFLLTIISLNAVCQRTKLKTSFEGTKFPTKQKIGYEFLLYFITGYSDSVDIYLDKKLIKSFYLVPMSILDTSYSPLKFSLNIKSSNLLEVKRKHSTLTHYIYLQKGYVAGLLYLNYGSPSEFLYTNNPPMAR